jgi:hypothetical protein
MHQADIRRTVLRWLAVKVDPLQERTETIPDPDDRDSDFVHCRKTSKLAVAARPGQESCHNIALFAERNPRGVPVKIIAQAGLAGLSEGESPGILIEKP